tara:strand:- start:13555 stop:14811 length:1257 start_codon:yes stop_codon:yes gene_type:complete
MNINDLYNIYLNHPNICIDSRQAKSNSIFFSIKGEKFNGNKFAEEALKKGCEYAIVDEEINKKNKKIILVDNCLKTLQQLASFHREKLNIPIIGITGSNGKTTSKELIYNVLSKQYKTHATKGNLNNHIGVPLSILEICTKTEISIIEMGANHINEISLLSNITKPNYGIITNIGKAHLKGFGGFNGVIQAKSELYENIKINNKQIFLNNDDKLLKKISQNINKITYGKTGDVNGILLESNLYAKVSHDETEIKSKLIGDYQFHNIMLAISVGKHFNISIMNIKNGIESYIPTNNRSEIIKTAKNTVILDAYNANPTSMKEMIISFSRKKLKNKICILGDMFELGDYSYISHKEIVTLVKELKIKTYFVGQEFKKVLKESFNSRNEFEIALSKKNISEKTILIKGSRGVKLEKLVTYL